MDWRGLCILFVIMDWCSLCIGFVFIVALFGIIGALGAVQVLVLFINSAIGFIICGSFSIFWLLWPLGGWLFVKLKKNKLGGGGGSRSVEEANEEVVNLLQRGDHIYTDRKGDTYSHHGIYVDRDNVIHFQNRGKAVVGISSSRAPPTLPSTSTCCEKCGYKPDSKGGVVKTCLDCFVNGHSLLLRMYPSSGEGKFMHRIYTLGEIVRVRVWVTEKGIRYIAEFTRFDAFVVVKQLVGVLLCILLLVHHSSSSFLPRSLQIAFRCYLSIFDLPTTYLWTSRVNVTTKSLGPKFKTRLSPSGGRVLGSSSYRMQICALETRSADQVIEEATNLLNSGSFGEYHLLKNNCEHFAVLCKTGMAVSSQVEVFKRLTFMGIAVICITMNAVNITYCVVVAIMHRKVLQ